MNMRYLLLFLLIAGCDTIPTSQYATPNDCDWDIQGRTYDRPQSTIEEVRALCDGRDGCTNVTDFDGFRVSFHYYLEGDEVVKIHEKLHFWCDGHEGYS